MGAPATLGERDYHSRLEAFFRGSHIPHPARAAAGLSARFATLSELLATDAAIVADYAGGGAAQALAGARALMTWAAREELREREPLHSTEAAARFLKTLIGFRCDECLVVLFLDARHGLIDHEIVAVGRADSVSFDQRRILLRAIGRGAIGIIVAHNHPSGDPRPSSSDIRVTRELADTARALGICLHDHLVAAGREVRSALFLN